MYPGSSGRYPPNNKCVGSRAASGDEKENPPFEDRIRSLRWVTLYWPHRWYRVVNYINVIFRLWDLRNVNFQTLNGERCFSDFHVYVVDSCRKTWSQFCNVSFLSINTEMIMKTSVVSIRSILILSSIFFLVFKVLFFQVSQRLNVLQFCPTIIYIVELRTEDSKSCLFRL